MGEDQGAIRGVNEARASKEVARMMKILHLALAVVMIAGPSFAQGFIGLYSDADTYAECNLVDATPGPCPVYLVQRGMMALSASAKVDASNAAGLVRTSVLIHTRMSIGDVFTGIEFTYGPCRGPTVLLATLNYFCEGTTPACASLEVVPHPVTGTISITDCTLPTPNVLQAPGGVLTINGDPSCPCVGANSVEATSWGRIKALYE